MEFQANRVFRTFIEWSLKHSQVGHLEHEAWLGSLKARHTAPFLRAVPEGNNSDTANAQNSVIFCDQLVGCLDTPNIHCTQESCIMLPHAHDFKDYGTQEIESVSREKIPNYMSLDNVTT